MGLKWYDVQDSRVVVDGTVTSRSTRALFAALPAIKAVEPVSPEAGVRIEKKAAAWLHCGKEHGGRW